MCIIYTQVLATWRCISWVHPLGPCKFMAPPQKKFGQILLSHSDKSLFWIFFGVPKIVFWQRQRRETCCQQSIYTCAAGCVSLIVKASTEILASLPHYVPAIWIRFKFTPCRLQFTRLKISANKVSFKPDLKYHFTMISHTFYIWMWLVQVASPDFF